MRQLEDDKEYDFVASLVFLLKGESVYLAPKNSKIGEKRLNGPGGELESYDTSIKACAVREAEQEFDVIIGEKDLDLRAIGYFKNLKSDGAVFVCKVYIFITRLWIGTPKATEEMGKPKLFGIHKLPYEKMMAADRFWIPEVLVRKRKVIIRATLKNKQSELVGEIEIIDTEKFE